MSNLGVVVAHIIKTRNYFFFISLFSSVVFPSPSFSEEKTWPSSFPTPFIALLFATALHSHGVP